jgi:hypothetical protein
VKAELESRAGIKAQELIRHQYAAVGAAARGALPETVGVLQAAAATGLDVQALVDRFTTRAALAERYTDAYRRYCWPVESLSRPTARPTRRSRISPTPRARSTSRRASSRFGSRRMRPFANSRRKWSAPLKR